MIKPAIFESSFDEALRKINLIKDTAQAIHIDIADGRLVSGKTFTTPADIDKVSTKTDIEVHLMVEYPYSYVEMLPNNVQTVISQVEIANIPDFLNICKLKNKYIALSLKPETAIDAVIPYLDDIKFIQFMSVEPGGQARKFHDEVLEKIKKFKEKYQKKAIQIDGAMYYTRIEEIEKNINIEHYVVGSDIFKSNDPNDEIKKLEDIIY